MEYPPKIRQPKPFEELARGIHALLKQERPLYRHLLKIAAYGIEIQSFLRKPQAQPIPDLPPLAWTSQASGWLVSIHFIRSEMIRRSYILLTARLPVQGKTYKYVNRRELDIEDPTSFNLETLLGLIPQDPTHGI